MKSTPSENPSDSALTSIPSQSGAEVSAVSSNVSNTMNGLPTIEIAGYKILAMPLELIPFTPEQQKRFKKEGGLRNPSMSSYPYKTKMAYWIQNIEEQMPEIDGRKYKRFELWKKIFEGFPEYAAMTEEQARERGLYPNICYRDFAARKWMAEMYGGHLAELDENYEGELRDICDATTGKTAIEKLASMGQAPIGSYMAGGRSHVYGLGSLGRIGSGSLSSDGYNFHSLRINRNDDSFSNENNGSRVSVSSIIILPK